MISGFSDRHSTRAAVVGLLPSPNPRHGCLKLRVDFGAGGAQMFDCQVRPRRDARHLRLRVRSADALLLTCPLRTSRRQMIAFIEQHVDWIQTQVATVSKPLSALAWLRKNPSLNAHGKSLEVRFFTAARRPEARHRFVDEGRAIALFAGVNASARVGPRETVEVQRSLREFAKEVLAARVYFQAERLDLENMPTRITVRDQRSRWGSCASSGALSLNWRLVLLPPELADYVILHELAHLRELNHSSRFWALLERYDPQRKAHEGALNALSERLMSVGRNDAG